MHPRARPRQENQPHRRCSGRVADLPADEPKEQENVILSAAASPIPGSHEYRAATLRNC
jgi:hypothetical protein